MNLAAFDFIVAALVVSACAAIGALLAGLS